MMKTTVTVKCDWSDNTYRHHFDDSKVAARFMTTLTGVSVKRIMRGMASNPSLPSFSAGVPGLFVRIEREI
jgi:hypothetical protein